MDISTFTTLTTHNMPLPSPSESQIIKTLNSSIQDLMQKIFQVKNDYQSSTPLYLHNPHVEEQPVLFNNTNGFHGFKKTGSKGEQSSTVVQTKQKNRNQNGVITKEFTRPRSNYTHNKTATMYNLGYNSPPTYVNKTISSKTIEKQHIKGLASPIMPKINSLFDSPCIKQVAESHIFSLDTTEGTCSQLEKQTRQVSQMSISTNQSSFVNLTLSQFQLGPEVGSGKFGQVYICRHKATGLVFALKKIFKSTIKQYKMESQFTLQLKILYMLNHPNIVKLYAHFHDEYHIFLLMEYVQGGQLLSKLKSDQKYVSRVIEQVICAVQYIHDRQIIHRDIKPQNIVISFDNTVKLCDFGWAGSFNYKNMKTTFCGTLDYVSPEMKDIGIYSSKVDLWSIGVLTYELLTGNAPFKNEINDWKKKGSKRSVPWDWHIKYPAQVSGLSQSFMRNLLKQNPDERASLRFCKNHYFIRKYKQQSGQINIQIYI